MSASRKLSVVLGLIALSLGVSACAGPADTPEEAVAASRTSAGELIQNGTFDHGTDQWVSWLMNGAAASFTARRGEAVIAVRTPGTSFADVQFHTGPGFALTAGKTYRLSFRARAEAPTTLTSSIWENGHDLNGDGSAWSTHQFDQHQLTTSMATYTVDFQMPVTNPDAGLCFFLGDARTTVHLDDVSLVEVVLPAPGTELITNGGFDQGVKEWVPWLMNGGQASFRAKDGQAMITVTAPATDYSGVQFHTGPGFPLFPGKYYRLSFRARADAPTTIATSIWENGHDRDGDGFPWSTYQFTYHQLTTEMAAHTVTFQVPGLNTDAGLCFFLGDVKGTVFLDDVSLVEVEPPPPGPELITNGTFADGLTSWVPWLMNGGQASFAAQDGQAAVQVIAPATDFSGIQLHTGAGLALEAGKTYRLTFRARADAPTAIESSVWENGHDLDGDGSAWSSYQFGYHGLTTELTTYTEQFVAPASNADAGLCFFLGDASGTVYLDDVSLVAVL